MAVIFNFVIDALSLLNLDSLKKTKKLHITWILYRAQEKKAAFLFFSMLYLLMGQQPLKMNANKKKLPQAL